MAKPSAVLYHSQWGEPSLLTDLQLAVRAKHVTIKFTKKIDSKQSYPYNCRKNSNNRKNRDSQGVNSQTPNSNGNNNSNNSSTYSFGASLLQGISDHLMSFTTISKPKTYPTAAQHTSYGDTHNIKKSCTNRNSYPEYHFRNYIDEIALEYARPEKYPAQSLTKFINLEVSEEPVAVQQSPVTLGTSITNKRTSSPITPTKAKGPALSLQHPDANLRNCSADGLQVRDNNADRLGGNDRIRNNFRRSAEDIGFRSSPFTPMETPIRNRCSLDSIHFDSIHQEKSPGKTKTGTITFANEECGTAGEDAEVDVESFRDYECYFKLQLEQWPNLLDRKRTRVENEYLVHCKLEELLFSYYPTYANSFYCLVQICNSWGIPLSEVLEMNAYVPRNWKKFGVITIEKEERDALLKECDQKALLKTKNGNYKESQRILSVPAMVPVKVQRASLYSYLNDRRYEEFFKNINSIGTAIDKTNVKKKMDKFKRHTSIDTKLGAIDYLDDVVKDDQEDLLLIDKEGTLSMLGTTHSLKVKEVVGYYKANMSSDEWDIFSSSPNLLMKNVNTTEYYGNLVGFHREVIQTLGLKGCEVSYSWIKSQPKLVKSKGNNRKESLHNLLLESVNSDVIQPKKDNKMLNILAITPKLEIANEDEVIVNYLDKEFRRYFCKEGKSWTLCFLQSENAPIVVKIKSGYH